MVSIRILSEKEKASLSEYAKIIVDYRRTGISLNHIIGCPINCAYCVRHFWGNFDMKTPHMLCSDEEAVEILINNKYFIKNDIPIQFLHKATDPFLPEVKVHTFRVLGMLDEMEISNIVMLITRYRVTDEDICFLDSLKHIRVCLFYTYSGINDKRIEPLASKEYAVEFAEVLRRTTRKRLKVIQYWRPVVNGWNDDENTINKVLSIADTFDAIVIKGLRHKKENDSYFKKSGIVITHDYGQYEKILTDESLGRIIEIYKENHIKAPIFYKNSCAISYCTESSDYNMQIMSKRSCNNCSLKQQNICEKGLQSRDLEDLKRILAKDVQMVGDGIYKIVDGTKEEMLFARHFLQKEVILEGKYD